MSQKKGGHDRRRWKATVRVLEVIHADTKKPVNLEVNEFSYEVLGWTSGVAARRAMDRLREEPEMYRTMLRKIFVSVEYMERYTQADEARENATDVIEEGSGQEAGPDPAALVG